MHVTAGIMAAIAHSACDCRNHGCNRAQCVLCKHNPNKRCTGNFAHKYWVGDKLLAKCEGEIQIELVDGSTGKQVTEDLSNIRLEVWVPLLCALGIKTLLDPGRH